MRCKNHVLSCTVYHAGKRNPRKWLKQIDLWTDVYLLRVLRAQQTISDITEYAEMIYRNLHPCYVSENALHLTLVKKTESDYRAKDNIDLQTSILAIHSLVSNIMGFLTKAEAS